jgi:hypothetical protein
MTHTKECNKNQQQQQQQQQGPIAGKGKFKECAAKAIIVLTLLNIYSSSYCQPA